MKLKCDIDDVEVPPKFLELLKHRDCDDCDCEQCDDAEFCISDFIGATEGRGLSLFYPDRIYPKEIADFLIEFELNTIPIHGGYPFEAELVIETSDEKTVVVAYGWPPSTDEAEYWTPEMVAYRLKEADA